MLLSIVRTNFISVPRASFPRNQHNNKKVTKECKDKRISHRNAKRNEQIMIQPGFEPGTFSVLTFAC
jgi:hypothetical protein